MEKVNWMKTEGDQARFSSLVYRFDKGGDDGNFELNAVR